MLFELEIRVHSSSFEIENLSGEPKEKRKLNLIYLKTEHTNTFAFLKSAEKVKPALFLIILDQRNSFIIFQHIVFNKFYVTATLQYFFHYIVYCILYIEGIVCAGII